MTDENPRMNLRSRRICHFGGFLTTLILLFSAFSVRSEPLNPVKAFYTYEDLLRMADDKIIQETPAKAFDFLIKAKELNPNPDYRYYNLMAMAHQKLGQTYEAIEAYEKSIQLKLDQTDLILYIADFYQKERKPKKSLTFTQLYLQQKPKAKYRIYLAGILSRQLGQEADYERYISELEADTTYSQEKEALQTSLAKQIRLRKWKEAEELCLRYLVYFPREEWMYETLILARRGLGLPSVEEAYQWAATVFLEETRYFVRYGVYLWEKERTKEALNQLRFGYYIHLKHHSEKSSDEILFLIRQCYTSLGREADTLAIDSLVKDSRNQTSLKEDLLEARLQSYRKNREYLVFGVYLFAKRQNKKASEVYELWRTRDQEMEEVEFSNILGPFTNIPQSFP